MFSNKGKIAVTVYGNDYRFDFGDGIIYPRQYQEAVDALCAAIEVCYPNKRPYMMASAIMEAYADGSPLYPLYDRAKAVASLIEKHCNDGYTGRDLRGNWTGSPDTYYNVFYYEIMSAYMDTNHIAFVDTPEILAAIAAGECPSDFHVCTIEDWCKHHQCRVVTGDKVPASLDQSKRYIRL